MESFEMLLASLIAGISVLTEVLKGLFAKFLPKVEFSPKFLTVVSAAITGAAVFLVFKPEFGGYAGALLMAFLSSSGLYDHILKPIKEIIARLRGIKPNQS